MVPLKYQYDNNKTTEQNIFEVLNLMSYQIELLRIDVRELGNKDSIPESKLGVIPEMTFVLADKLDNIISLLGKE